MFAPSSENEEAFRVLRSEGKLKDGHFYLFVDGKLVGVASDFSSLVLEGSSIIADANARNKRPFIVQAGTGTQLSTSSVSLRIAVAVMAEKR